jgi:hypothetical protein
MKHDILGIARRWVTDMGSGRIAEKQQEYYSQSIQLTEYPNLLNSRITSSDYTTLLQRSEQGSKILTRQSYDIQKEYVSGDTVIMEVIWKGSFSIPVGQTPPGRELKAYFVVFLEFEGDKVVRQRNYDCFEPF